MTQWAIHRLAQTMTIIALDGEFGSLHVILLGLEDERNLIQWRCGGKLIYQWEVELNVIFRLISSRATTLIHHHLAISLDIHEMGMSTRDDCRSLCIARITIYLDIEFVYIALLQLDVDVGILYILLALRQGIGSQILQYFKLILRLAYQGTE